MNLQRTRLRHNDLHGFIKPKTPFWKSLLEKPKPKTKTNSKGPNTLPSTTNRQKTTPVLVS